MDTVPGETQTVESWLVIVVRRVLNRRGDGALVHLPRERRGVGPSGGGHPLECRRRIRPKQLIR